MNAPISTPARRRSSFTRGLIFAALATLFAFLPAAARADSNTTYDVSGTLADGSGFSGVLNFDTNSGGVTTLVDSTITMGGITFSCDGASSNDCIVQNAGALQYFQAQNGFSLVLIYWNAVTFPNPPAGITFDGGYCMNCSAPGMINITGGTGVAAPEPSALALLIMGLFIAGFLAHAIEPRPVA
jgi:hypothetical protein